MVLESIRVSEDKELRELFFILLRFIGLLNINLENLLVLVNNSKISADVPNISDSSTEISCDTGDEKDDIIDSYSSSKLESVTVVERSIGNYHKMGNDAFYINLQYIVESTPLYRGRVPWSRVLELLKSDSRYNEVTNGYLAETGYGSHFPD